MLSSLCVRFSICLCVLEERARGRGWMGSSDCGGCSREQQPQRQQTHEMRQKQSHARSGGRKGFRRHSLPLSLLLTTDERWSGVSRADVKLFALKNSGSSSSGSQYLLLSHTCASRGDASPDPGLAWTPLTVCVSACARVGG